MKRHCAALAIDGRNACGAFGFAAASRLGSAQNIALHEVGRQAIMADPDWRSGNYLAEGVRPQRGLAIARMIGHISYLSEVALTQKFGRALQDRDAVLLEKFFPQKKYIFSIDFYNINFSLKNCLFS